MVLSLDLKINIVLCFLLLPFFTRKKTPCYHRPVLMHLTVIDIKDVDFKRKQNIERIAIPFSVPVN